MPQAAEGATFQVTGYEGITRGLQPGVLADRAEGGTTQPSTLGSKR